MRNLAILGLFVGVLLGGCLTDAVDTTGPVDDHSDESGDVEAIERTVTYTTTAKCQAPKVQICHLPGGDPNKAMTLCIAAPAVSAHTFHHGDSIGACPEVRVCSDAHEVCSDDSDCCTGTCGHDETCRNACVPYWGSCDSTGDCCNGGGCFDGVCVPQA